MTETATILPVGTKVSATYPNGSWGDGEIVEVRPERSEGIHVHGIRKGSRIKRYVVRRDDGQIGYFALDQIAAKFPRSGSEAKQMGMVDEYAAWMKAKLVASGQSEDQAEATRLQIVERFG